MRVVLADLKGAEGLVSKDTVVGGYGSRSKSFTRVTGVLSQIKWRSQVALSVQMAELAAIAADFVISGEPEEAFTRLIGGERLAGVCPSREAADLDSLPFPRWDLLAPAGRPRGVVPFAGRPLGGGFPLLASRSCPEFCTYCPIRILATYRTRSVGSIAGELQQLCESKDVEC